MSSLEALQDLKKAWSPKEDATYEIGKWSTWGWLRNQPDTRDRLKRQVERCKLRNRGRLQDATCLSDPYKEAIEGLRRIYYPTYTCCTYCENHRLGGVARELPGQFEEYVYYIEKLRDLDNG